MTVTSKLTFLVLKYEDTFIFSFFYNFDILYLSFNFIVLNNSQILQISAIFSLIWNIMDPQFLSKICYLKSYKNVSCGLIWTCAWLILFISTSSSTSTYIHPNDLHLHLHLHIHIHPNDTFQVLTSYLILT